MKFPLKLALIIVLQVGAIILAVNQVALADNPGPANVSVGLEGKISAPPPSRGATIGVPSNGAIFSSEPITVSGICTTGLLVKIFDNNVFVGSTICSNNNYTLQIDLFSGQNDLIARVYDALDQAGPDSSTVTVTFNDAQFFQFGTHISLSSTFAERGAPPNTQLTWPILLSGGIGPYAMSVDWGDGSALDLLSEANAGTINIKHTYKIPGIYKVIVKATDKNGATAFLQLTGQATGAIQSNNKSPDSGNIIVEKQVAWWPSLSAIPLILAAFWIGRRHELYTLKRQFDKEAK